MQIKKKLGDAGHPDLVSDEPLTAGQHDKGAAEETGTGDPDAPRFEDFADANTGGLGGRAAQNKAWKSELAAYNSDPAAKEKWKARRAEERARFRKTKAGLAKVGQ